MGRIAGTGQSEQVSLTVPTGTVSLDRKRGEYGQNMILRTGQPWQDRYTGQPECDSRDWTGQPGQCVQPGEKFGVALQAKRCAKHPLLTSKRKHFASAEFCLLKSEIIGAF